MSDVLKNTYEIQASTIIKALEKRNMKGCYCPDCSAAHATGTGPLAFVPSKAAMVKTPHMYLPYFFIYTPI